MKLFNLIKKISKIYLKEALLLLFLFSISFAVQAQNQRITIRQKQTTILSAFEEIEKQTNLKIAYNEKAIDVNKNISVDITDKTLPDALSDILKDTNMTFKIEGRQIMIIPVITTNLSKKYDGIVIDAKNEPIIGATVTVKDSKTGTVTDVDGKFSIETPVGSTFIITFIGYVTQEIKADNQTNLYITLVEDTKYLDEVVVVGYGTMLRKNLTTAISSIKTENISKSAISNISQLLLGQAAGLQATLNSSQPGGSVNLSIRGSGTPLFIVDGIMMPYSSFEVGSGETQVPNYIDRSGLVGLNPSDIESIEILKDASAAIYGIGAANGVVLITTQKGSSRPPKIVYDANFSTVQNTSYLNPLNAQEYMNLMNVMNKEVYLLNNDQYPYGEKPFDNNWTPLFSAVEIENAQTTHWLDCVLKTGSISNQNISITGGTDKFKYYLGGNYYNYKGSVANAGMEKYSLRTNVSSQLFPFLKMTVILNINQNNYLNSTVGADAGQGDHGFGALDAALSFPSYIPIKNEGGEYSIYRNFPNPEALLSINDRSTTNGYYTNISADVDIIKNMLAVKLLYGVNSENNKRSIYIPSDIYFNQMLKSRGNLGYGERMNQTMEATLSFQKRLGDLLSVDAVAGIGRYLENWAGMSTSYDNANDRINNDNLAAAEGPYYPASFRGANERRSQFGRASLDILDRYILSGTLRRDGTDKFFPDSKYAYFPSVSAAWKISNEKFLENLQFINLLKLRASYGKTGRDNLGTSVYGLFSPAANYVKFDNNSTTYIPYLLSSANYSDVGWEKSTMSNIGLDFSILKDRISGSFDVYRNDNTRLLGSAPTAPLGMFGTRPINGGHYKKEGWDLSINTSNVKTIDFKWNSLFTFTHYNSIWVERMPNYDYAEYQIQKNEPMNRYYYYNVVGIINIDKSNMPESQKSLQTAAQLPGCPIIEDRNNDGRITIDDIYMKDTDPDIYLGFGNTFIYKNFDLDIFMYGQFGVDKNNIAWDWANPGYLMDTNPRNTNQYAFNVWNSQTNPTGTIFPGITAARVGALPGNAGTNLYYQDASFVRVRNITLGYNLTGSSLGSFNTYISNIRLYADVQNPFTFTGFDGIDPEIRQSGGGRGRGLYPQTRTFSLGLKFTF